MIRRLNLRAFVRFSFAACCLLPLALVARLTGGKLLSVVHRRASGEWRRFERTLR